LAYKAYEVRLDYVSPKYQPWLDQTLLIRNQGVLNIILSEKIALYENLNYAFLIEFPPITKTEFSVKLDSYQKLLP